MSDLQDQFKAALKQAAGGKGEVKKLPGKPVKPVKPPKEVKIAYDADAYLLIGGSPVLVNGLPVYSQVSKDDEEYLRAGDFGESYEVRLGNDRVYKWVGLTYEDGIAAIAGKPLSLEKKWPFQWGVVIADKEKYVRVLLDKWGMRVTGQGQIHVSLGTVDGYDIHISIKAGDVRTPIRKALEKGEQPADGFLSGIDFHVTVEAWGKDHKDNPRAFNYVAWQGSVPKDLQTSAATARKMGEDWLNTF